MINLENKIVVVTGAAQGNGATIAKGLSRLGAILVLADLNEEKLQHTRDEISQLGKTAYAYVLNISDRDSCIQFAEMIKEEIGGVDVLVNNAGILRRSTFESETTFKDLEDTLNVNIKGTFYLSHALLDLLKQSKGNIVNVASIQSFVASPTATAYSISKGGVAQMTKTLAVELAKYGIRVNAIAPGIINTPMSHITRSNPDTLNSFLKHVPLAREGQSEELVGPVAFLCSETASYVTGCILPVDGGYLTV